MVSVPLFVLPHRWLARLWNVLVVPRIEDAVISMVTAKHSPLQQRSPSNKSLSPGQRAVVRAALNIVLNKAVLHSCPLDRSGAVLKHRGAVLTHSEMQLHTSGEVINIMCCNVSYGNACCDAFNQFFE